MGFQNCSKCLNIPKKVGEYFKTKETTKIRLVVTLRFLESLTRMKVLNIHLKFQG